MNVMVTVNPHELVTCQTATLRVSLAPVSEHSSKAVPVESVGEAGEHAQGQEPSQVRLSSDPQEQCIILPLDTVGFSKVLFWGRKIEILVHGYTCPFEIKFF